MTVIHEPRWCAVTVCSRYSPVESYEMTDLVSSSFTLNVEHRKISSGKSFSKTAIALETLVPHVDDGIWERLENGDAAAVRKELENGPPLLIFLKRDHGSTDKMIDYGRNCFQYEIGPPLTASKMTSRNLAAGLYAPLRVVLYENASGGSTFEYDLPSTQFGQFENPDVTAIGIGLDAEILKALSAAAS